jgi:hypothetical protein
MKKLQMKDPRTTRVADLKPGQYADGSALDDVQYLECELILKPDEFTSPKGFKRKLVAQAAKECGVGFDTSGAKKTRPAIREVLFLDTGDFKLYNNAFILRRRVQFEDGFPVGEPEVVFKFRYPDQQSRRRKSTCGRTFRANTGSSSRRRRCRCATASAAAACSSRTTRSSA